MTQFDDLGKVTLTEDFPYSVVDHEQEPETPLLMASEAMRRVMEWVYQAPCQDLDGFQVRSIVACWVFVPLLRDYSMTQIAGRFGKKKQSLGRWVDDFKRQFPEITKHMQHIRHTEEQ